MARSRAFRWGEDGIAGVSDSHGFQNIAFAFWNEKEYVCASATFATQADFPAATSSKSAFSDCPTLRVTTASRSKSAIFTWTTRQQYVGFARYADIANSIVALVHEISVQISSCGISLRAIG